MGWIKRNLIFVIGGVLALVLLGVAGDFIYNGWSHNSEAAGKLNEIYDTLKSLAAQKPSPGNEKINNTKIAQEQIQQLRAWIANATACYQPVPAIPEDKIVSNEAFASALRRTVDGLQHEADSAGVTLPPKYDFSFSGQRTLVKFAEGSREPIAAQLGEVKVITEILLAARINALMGIQRVRISDDDASGPQSDYIDQRPLTNDLAVLTPYVVTFRCFTPELSRVISGFAAAPNAFIIKSVNVQPAAATATATTTAAATPPPPGSPMRMGDAGTPPPPPVSPAADKGGLQIVLKEQLLQITMEVDLVKLLPKR